MREHEINKLDNFICGWYLEDTSICDKLVDYHNNNPASEGVLQNHDKLVVDKTLKDSYDVTIKDRDLWTEYCVYNLQPLVNLYREKYPHVDNTSRWGLTDVVNIQKYNPSGGYHAWHHERGGSAEPFISRHLVFMTYLNDVTDAGETEFYYQHLKIKPQKGLTIIWPAEWMYTHRGVTSLTQEKYIVTGWYNLMHI